MSALGAAIGKGIGAVGGPQVAAVVVAVGLVDRALGGGLIAGGAGRPGHDEGRPLDLPVPRQRPGTRDRRVGPEVPRHRQERRRELGADLLPAAGPHRGVGDVGTAPDRGLDDGDPGRALLAGRSPDRAPRASPARRSPRSRTTARRPHRRHEAADPAAAAQRRAEPRAARGVAGHDRGRTAALLREHRPRGHRQRPRHRRASAIASVVLSFRRPGLSGYATKPMTRGGGASTWQATLRTDTDGIDTAGDLRFFVSATDSAPNPRSARLPADGAGTITVAGCVNKGPTLRLGEGEPGHGVHEPRGLREQPARDDDRPAPRPTSTASRDDAPLPPARRPGRPPGGDDEERRIVEDHGDAESPATRTRGARRRTRWWRATPRARPRSRRRACSRSPGATTRPFCISATAPGRRVR